MPATFDTHGPSPLRPTAPLLCVTMPWEVPEQTIVVEYHEGRWRVVTPGRAVRTFARREDALTHARAIAVLYLPWWTIVERDPPTQDAVAC